MDFGVLRQVALTTNFAVHGIPATVTRPAPDDTPIETRVIWLTPITNDYPGGSEFSRREPDRVIAFRRDEVPTVPRGTLVLAPEASGGAIQRWRTDGTERVEADHVRAHVVKDPVVPEI